MTFLVFNGLHKIMIFFGRKWELSETLAFRNTSKNTLLMLAVMLLLDPFIKPILTNLPDAKIT